MVYCYEAIGDVVVNSASKVGARGLIKNSWESLAICDEFDDGSRRVTQSVSRARLCRCLLVCLAFRSSKS